MDRNILRLAAYELLYRPDAPVAAVVNEAVELAKKYSTAESGRFVNGVLGALARQPRGETAKRADGRGHGAMPEMSRFEMRPFALPEAETGRKLGGDAEDVWDVPPPRRVSPDGRSVAAWTYEADFAFTLRRDGDLVAYGEIVEDVVEHDVEIQHLLVAPDMRSAGVGKALLSRLCAFLAASRPYPEVWLRVGRDNAPAAACARAVGFEDDPAMSGPRFLWLKKPSY